MDHEGGVKGKVVPKAVCLTEKEKRRDVRSPNSLMRK